MNDILRRIEAAFPPPSWRDLTTLVAVSGGADSVALLRALVLLKNEPVSRAEGRLIAAHFNHRLRGGESDGDEEFVRGLAAKLAVRFEVGLAEKNLQPTGGGLEAAARAARYEFLTETAKRVGARYIVTAHTLDDQVETILHRILRGTGIAGLVGIPRAREIAPGISLVRPLLGINRSDIRDFLTAHNQPFREDSSNASAQFTRNRIRGKLLPYLEREFNSDVRGALVRLARLAEENQDYLKTQTASLLSERVKSSGRDVVIQCSGLEMVHRHLVRELLIRIWTENLWPQQGMTLEKWDELAALAQSPGAQAHPKPEVQILPGSLRAERRGNELRLTPP